MKQRINNWKMNVFDLEQEEFIEKLNKEMKEFYKLNDTDGMEKRTIWDAREAYIRGMEIQYRIRRTRGEI